MITEAEAKTKWCPMARVAEVQRFGSSEPDCPVAAVNRGSDALKDAAWAGHSLCIASACMMWRVGDPVFVQNEKPFVAVEHAPGQFRKEYAAGVRVERGYCGLAGHPNPAFILGKG